MHTDFIVFCCVHLHSRSNHLQGANKVYTTGFETTIFSVLKGKPRKMGCILFRNKG